MHLFYDIMLYQQFLYFSYQKAIPIYQFILPNLKNMPSVIRIRCRLMGSPRLAYFFANNAFRNFGTKTYCKLIATANRKKPSFFPRECLFLLKSFFLPCSESRMAVFMWLAIMARYNQFLSHLNQQVRTDCNNQKIVNSVWVILSNSPISEFWLLTPFLICYLAMPKISVQMKRKGHQVNKNNQSETCYFLHNNNNNNNLLVFPYKDGIT